MKGLSIVAALICATPALAQEPSVDPDAVRACFDGAKDTHPACIGEAAATCQGQPGGDTTLGISACLQGEAQVWDDIAKSQYKAARARLLEQGGTELANKLLDAQSAWGQYRDADCGLLYEIWKDGTIRTVVASQCYLERTAQRALELRDLGRME
ncbi:MULTISPECIES: lysozyme inhibitor LprI family protein [Thioclava]|uniref:lysozyme inhibitor LprI family protein n=1 Tax=Thioclava TaxID=285107 RepID=UPI000998208F|nr:MULTISPECIES: lysozyme inhibitor LprI family protein [Thioclava]MAQ36481.1 DUF1311 domain-containing protein [Thioclava sp.]OOY09403.1 hypothetical protein BMI89_06195 [Thioclava sp. F36-7]|tara:strand:- start:301 stop:765 length:465 start_codon:yes stop_codon:yes gene_type:complete